MKKVFVDLLTSKKFVALLAGLVTIIVNAVFGLQLREDVVLSITAMVSAYLVGQGVADAGKERAKIEMDNG